jgi:hypothetical protein
MTELKHISECKTLDDLFELLHTGTLSPEAVVAEKCWEEIQRLREYEWMYKELCK